MDTVEITWEQIAKLTKKLAQAISTMFPAKEIMLIPMGRGGLVPCGLLGYELGIQDIYIPFWGQYYPGNRVMIFVDDIADSGRTIYEHKETFKISYSAYPLYATLVTRASCPVRPQFTALNFPTAEWIIFPWAPADTPTSRNAWVAESRRDEGGSFRNGGEEIQGGVLLGRDASRGSRDGDGTLHDGPGEVRQGQLEEGNPLQQPTQPSGEPLPQPEEQTSLQQSEEGGQ